MYEWIKAFHVMAVIAWMAAMLYLPRLMVYHAEAPVGSAQSDIFKVMERRLLRGIMTPSMIATWALGLYLAWSAFAFKGGWLHGKILLVFILSGIHGYLVGRVRAFAEDRNDKSPKFYRIINEVPAVLMALIVILVIVKPF
jgi:putative membrane protein